MTCAHQFSHAEWCSITILPSVPCPILPRQHPFMDMAESYKKFYPEATRQTPWPNADGTESMPRLATSKDPWLKATSKVLQPGDSVTVAFRLQRALNTNIDPSNVSGEERTVDAFWGLKAERSIGVTRGWTSRRTAAFDRLLTHRNTRLAHRSLVSFVACGAYLPPVKIVNHSCFSIIFF